MNPPAWIKIKAFDRIKYSRTLDLIGTHRLNTVCVSGNCPNRYECFSRGTATFLILGNACTRHCLYCNISGGEPAPADPEEPARIASAAQALGLRYVVVTAVSRDDLSDGGAGQFVKTVDEIRKSVRDVRVELLISDLNGNESALKDIVEAKPDVLNHNLETARRLFPVLRPQGDYKRSLALLSLAKKQDPAIRTKSGLMAGLGESRGELIGAMKDLRVAGCDDLTIGQYLRPSKAHAPVKKYYRPAEFAALADHARVLGFKNVSAGPLVRSSYHAHAFT